MAASAIAAPRLNFGEAAKQVIGFCDNSFKGLHQSMLGIEGLKSRVMDLTRSINGQVSKDEPIAQAEGFVEEYRAILRQWEIAKIIQERLSQVIQFCTRPPLSQQALELIRDLGLPDNSIVQKETALNTVLQELQEKLKYLNVSILQGFHERANGLQKELENALIAANNGGVAAKVAGYVPPLFGGGTRLKALLDKQPAIKSQEEFLQEFSIKGLDTPYQRPVVATFSTTADALNFLAKTSGGSPKAPASGSSSAQNGSGSVAANGNSSEAENAVQEPERKPKGPPRQNGSNGSPNSGGSSASVSSSSAASNAK